MIRRRCTNGDESDAYEARRIYFWKPGQAKAVKRRTNHRERREGKAEIRAQLADR